MLFVQCHGTRVPGAPTVGDSRGSEQEGAAGRKGAGSSLPAVARIPAGYPGVPRVPSRLCRPRISCRGSMRSLLSAVTAVCAVPSPPTSRAIMP
eukprot:3551813-Rhodomonas_salina.1